MIAIIELKNIYDRIPKHKRNDLVKELSDFFNLSEDTVRSHYLSRWRLPKKAYKEQARKDFKTILLKYV